MSKNANKCNKVISFCKKDFNYLYLSKNSRNNAQNTKIKRGTSLSFDRDHININVRFYEKY